MLNSSLRLVARVKFFAFDDLVTSLCAMFRAAETVHLIPLLRAFNPDAVLHNVIKASIKNLAWRDAPSRLRVKSIAQHKKN
jgi:hypothetical protein